MTLPLQISARHFSKSKILRLDRGQENLPKELQPTRDYERMESNISKEFFLLNLVYRGETRIYVQIYNNNNRSDFSSENNIRA